MPERQVVLDKEKIVYSGLFSVTELSKHLRDAVVARGYTPKELKWEESVSKDGKYVMAEWRPDKKFSEYARGVIKMSVEMSGVKEVSVAKDGKKQKLNEGKVTISFVGLLETDYEARWESKAGFTVIRTLFEKYVYGPYVAQFEKKVRDDVVSIKDNMKALLNLYKY